MRIDSHIHFWKYDKDRQPWINKDMRALRSDFLPENILTSLRRNQVDGCIAVEASSSEVETHFLVELARSHSMIKGVVGWVDFASPLAKDRLDYFSQFPEIKGWRYGLESRAPGFMDEPVFREAISRLKEKGYVFDLLVKPAQLSETARLVNENPDQVFVLDHAGQPDIRDHQINGWKEEIKRLAQYPNLHCKLSGWLTLAKWKDWSASDFYPYLDVVFEQFGVSRLLFGSDWPILTLSGIYVQWVSLLEKYMENLSAEDKEMLFGGNATRLYNLNPLTENQSPLT